MTDWMLNQMVEILGVECLFDWAECEYHQRRYLDSSYGCPDCEAGRAHVRLEPAWEPGRWRRRCVECEKIAYDNEVTANRAARFIATRGVLMRWYFKAACGWWHLSTDRKRVRRAGWDAV